MQGEIGVLLSESWAKIVQTWLAQESLVLFAPEAPELVVSRHELEMRAPCSACSPNEASRWPLGSTDCLLARKAADIIIRPPVTERQGQVQAARIQEVLTRYALHPEVSMLLSCHRKEFVSFCLTVPQATGSPSMSCAPSRTCLIYLWSSQI